MPVPLVSTPMPAGARPTTGWPACVAVSGDDRAGYRRVMMDWMRSAAAAVPRAAASVPRAAAAVPRGVGSLYDRAIDRGLPRPYQITTADEARALLEDPESIDVSAFADQIQQVAIIALPLARRFGTLARVPGLKKVPWVLSIVTVANVARAIRQGVREV